MQTLKDGIRGSILLKAKISFLEQGFEKTSMRDIAHKIGVSVGNLYRYYPNKEALFDAVVMPAYEGLAQLIQVQDVEHGIESSPPGLQILEELSRILSELLHEHREGLLILLYGSTGTRHERAKEELFSLLMNHIHTHIKEFNKSQLGNPHAAEALDLQVSRPIAVAFLEGYFEIIRLYSDPEQIRTTTKQYVTVWFMGLQQLI
ncbi:TetR/AcrR family transcriptional regulator [Paenibacillus sp. KN14-4R]|uniref:TetR/AcrR family transcriptional regulator n=1 Tax=Paenibacillus sp. KN14-4R TaxID=3445773 RepID=UPI003F9EFC32